MSNLFSSLYLGLTSLRAQQIGLSVAGQNVANVNTPGYSRQRAIFDELDPLRISEGQLGRGVRVADITAIRDRFVEARLVRENAPLGQLDVMNQTLRQIDGLFSEPNGNGIRDALSKFFNSFSDLANNPTNLGLRQQVLAAGNTLATSIRNAYTQLQTIQNLTNQDIKSTVDQVNQLAGQIAALNDKVAAAEGLGHDATSLRDQRQVLLGQLGQLVNINYVETDNRSVDVMIGGRSIVSGNTVTNLSANPVNGPFYSIFMGPTDITGEINSGKLNGLLQLRNNNITGYMNDLDTLAGTLINQVNTVHRNGSDLNGVVGGNFFTPTPNGSSPAQTLSVAITDPARIAAAGLGRPAGDNTNARALAALATARIPALGSATFSEFYGGLATRIGTQAKDAADGFKVQKQVVRQVQNQRDAISGVSLDEEMASIVQFQKAYEASARFISIVSSLTEETMRLVGGR